MEADIDDTHLCIKCTQTIVGLENYIQHRKQNCNRNPTVTTRDQTKPTNTSCSTSTPHHRSVEATPPINYEPFHFNEPEPPTSSSHGGKTSKNLSDNYDLPYELGADVFFSSLQLQSVQSSVPSQTGGKTGAPNQAPQLQRQKSLQSDNSTQEVESWIRSHGSGASQHQNSDKLLKAVNDMGETKKSYDTIFKPITFVQESPEMSEEEEEEEADVEVDVDIEDDDEDYDPMVEVHATGGKWKLPLMRHSPPVVPASHTGGKWKPENRPNLRVAHSQLSRLSPNWDEHMDEVDANDGQHPPWDHTKGKWIPGTKLQRLEYKEEVELAKLTTKQDYWCNICCRKLKSKAIYENHLKTSYHLKRSEPETQLEKAVMKELSREDIKKSFTLETSKMYSVSSINSSGKKRKRRSTYLRCNLCKHNMARHLIGKHLISHYHYRRMQIHPGLSLHMILENIHSIVLQSPFQCRPCRFYTNTEETFLLHWNSASHLDASECPGRFWCSYCQFECEDNNQMRRHLLGPEHKEVLLAINRSVPVCISKRLSIDCPKCGAGFRFNFELRQHIRQQHPGVDFLGTASDAYQSKFKCPMCPEVLSSKIALQRHEKFKHAISKYFCSICSLEFKSPCQARRHRKTLDHKRKAGGTTEGQDDVVFEAYPKQAGITKKEGSSLAKQTLGANSPFQKETSVNLKKPPAPSKSLEIIEVKAVKRKSNLNPEPHTTPPTYVRQFKLKIIPYEQPSTSAASTRSSYQQKALEIRKTLKCIDCQQKFDSRQQLKEHREKEHTLSQCMICGENFVTAQELGQHSRKCQPRILTTETEVRTEELSPKDKPRTTVINSEQNTLYQCDLCAFKAPFQSEIIYHSLFHSIGPMGTKQLVKCLLCDKTFRKHSLRCHLRQHTNEKIYKCHICEASYTRPHNLKDHVDKAHGTKAKQEKNNKKDDMEKKTFQCHTCGKVFKSKQTLQIHCLTHHVTTQDPRFMCPHEDCDYGTVNNVQLKVHLASHSIERFKCLHRDCNYVGKSELHLKRHQKTHLPDADVKIFHCNTCKFKTRIKGHLQRHMRCHTGEKPYQCQHCDFRTNVLENLRKHVLKTGKHPGKFMYECTLCEEEVRRGNKTEMHPVDICKTNSFVEYQKHLAKVHNRNKTDKADEGSKQLRETTS